MTPDLQSLIALASQHQWMPVAILVIGYIVRLSKDDSRFPVSIPERWRPVLVLVLGQVYAALQSVQSGASWKVVAWHGLTTAVWTMGLYSLVMKALFNGKEPAFMKLIAMVLPPPPPAEPPAAEPAKPEDTPTGK